MGSSVIMYVDIHETVITICHCCHQEYVGSLYIMTPRTYNVSVYNAIPHSRGYCIITCLWSRNIWHVNVVCLRERIYSVNWTIHGCWMLNVPILLAGTPRFSISDRVWQTSGWQHEQRLRPSGYYDTQSAKLSPNSQADSHYKLNSEWETNSNPEYHGENTVLWVSSKW